MPRKSHHVVSNPNGGWSVKKESASRASKHFDKKSDAVTWAKNQSQKEGAELVVHDKDGTITRKDSYGNDSKPPKDRK